MKKHPKMFQKTNFSKKKKSKMPKKFKNLFEKKKFEKNFFF